MVRYCDWSKRWILIDWRQSHTDFLIFFDFEIQELMQRIHEQKGTVVRFAQIPAPTHARGLVTYCSNMISRYVGLGNRLILTPYRLYRMLLQSGGEVVYSWSDENEHRRFGSDEDPEEVRENIP